MCRAVLLAGLIGVGVMALGFGGGDMHDEGDFDEARSAGQIEFIDWDGPEQPELFAPWI